MANKTELLNNVTRAFHKGVFQLKKHSPEILIVAGVVGTVTSAVMACKATTKVNAILEDAKNQIDVIHSCTETGDVLGEDYTEEDGKKDLAIVYAQTGVKLAKLYGPAIVLGGLSLGAIVTSHNIQRKRNIALAAAFTAADNSLKSYRGRVIERFGEAIDRELMYNIKAKEVEEVVVNEDGTETTVTKTVEVGEIPGYSVYARFFDDGCKGWSKDPELNLLVLRQVEEYANIKLKRQGYLFLNDVYKALGIPETASGQIVGWIYDAEHPVGDNKVDFGIYDNIHDAAKRRFVNGYERTILLDFNVDGNILDMM